jgi:type IV pilus assembly protein PilA
MICPYCAEAIPDGGEFCPLCGTRIGKAVGSLICGIFFFFLPASIAAIVLGHLSLSEIRKSAGRLKGQGIAISGLVLGYIGVAFLPFVLILAAIAIPNLLRAKIAANEASVVGALQSYKYALGAYAAECPKKGFPASLANLGSGRGCAGARLLDDSLGTEHPTRFGYVFHYTPGTPDNLGQVTSFTLSAEPVKTRTTGVRSFFMDQSGVIRCASSGIADADSPPLE